MARPSSTEPSDLARSPRISVDSVDKLYRIRAQELENRQPLIPLWTDIARKMNPAMADWNDDTTSMEVVPNFKDLTSNVGMKASIQLADGIEAYAFSRNSPWLRLATEDQNLMERRDVRLWLQLLSLHCYRQLLQSGWYDAARSWVRVGVDFATSVMMRTNNIARGLPAYQTLHLKRAVIMENENGEVDTLFRDLWLTAFDAASAFGLENLPVTIQDAFREKLNKKFSFQQFIHPLDKFALDIGARESKGKRWHSLYVADIDHDHPIREGGYYTFPAFAWRFARNPSGSAYGTDSPGYLEISNVKQVNGMRKDYHRGVQSRFRPQIKATDQLEGRINFDPNGVTYLGQGEDFTQAFTIGDTKGLLDDIMRMEDGVMDSYHKNLFLILTANIERLKTATEVEGIKGEQAAMLTAFFGRLSTEGLEPMVEDVVQLELESGRAPPPPPIMKNQAVKVDLISPLAILQKRYLLLDNTRQFLAEVAGLVQSQLAPDGADNVDFNQYIRSAADIYHIDERVLRDLADVKKIQQARAAARMQMAQEEAANKKMIAQAQAYKAGAVAPQPGSPAAQRIVFNRPQGGAIQSADLLSGPTTNVPAAVGAGVPNG
jgi:hypothetical protein